MTLAELEQYLAREREEILRRCTGCGRCVAACPMLPHLPIKSAPVESTARGLLALLRGEHDAGGAVFAEACCGTGACREACPEGLVPYTFMRLAKLAANELGKVRAVTETGQSPQAVTQHSAPSTQHSPGPAARPKPGVFRLIELSRRVQMPGEPEPWFKVRPPEGLSAEVVFYLGCNVLRTPHIALNAVELMRRTGVDFQTLAGGGNCCGILPFRQGRWSAADAVAASTYRNFAAFSPRQVVTWCPTCQLHFKDFGAAYLERPFRVVHVTRFLLEHLDLLRSQFLRPVCARVAIEEHAPLNREESVTEDVKALLRAVPGLEVVDLPQRRYGYHCGAVRNRSAAAQARGELFEAASGAGVEHLVTLYHSCHREMVRAEERYPFRVVHFTSLLARALGVEREDRYRHYKLMESTGHVLAEVLATQGSSGRDLEDLPLALEWEFGRK